MKTSIKILSLLAGLFFITSSAFGDDATNYYNSGCAESSKGDLDGAIADYNKAIELNPKYINASGVRSWVINKNGDTNGPEADFQKAIEKYPKLMELIKSKIYLTNGTNSN